MKIAVCAGEKSGDALGHELLIDLKENIDNLEVIGVGGSMMEGEGLKSFFPIKEISYISPLWTYKVLTFLSVLMIIGELFAFLN